MALIWVNEFISFGKEKVLPLGASLLTGILPSLSHKNKGITLLPILGHSIA